MKQKKKIKLDLETAGYRDYVRHFGVKVASKKWKEHKEKEEQKVTTLTPKIIKTADKLMKEKLEENLEPIQQAILRGTEQLDIRKNELDVLECGTSMVELIRMPAWYKWIKPQIQKDAVDFVKKTLMLSGEKRDEAAGGYNYTRKILKRIDRWIQDYTFVVKREEEKKNAIQAKR